PMSYLATETATSTALDPIVFGAGDFSPNTHIISTSTDDAECVTLTDKPFGYYIYGEERVGGSGWQTPRYNDQNDTEVEDLSDFFAFSTTTDENADGYIIIGPTRTDRTL